MKLLVAGIAKDIGYTWHQTSAQLQKIFNSVDDYVAVIVESNSSDNTLECLQEWEKADSRRNVISLGNFMPEVIFHHRVLRMAACRNKYIEFLEPFYQDYDYLLIVDMDHVLLLENDFKEQLESCFIREDWDAVASNRSGRYYDIGALLSEHLGITKFCWHNVYSEPWEYINSDGKIVPRDNIQEFVGKFQMIIPRDSEWIKCESAFGGMCLYKTKSIYGRRYSTTCTYMDHISFNEGMRIFINPKFISGETSEHLIDMPTIKIYSPNMFP